MAIEIYLGTTNKKRNSTKVPSPNTTALVELKEPTSIIRPSFIISVVPDFDIHGLNCCYVPKFKRYYFIVNITWLSGVHAQIDCEVDVLATYRSQILATKAYINRAASRYNIGIADHLYPAMPKNTQIVQSTGRIPALSPKDGTFCLVVSTESSTGQTGLAQGYALSASELGSLANKLFADDTIQKIKESVYNPITAVASCVWTPVSWAQATAGGNVEVKVGEYSLGTYSTIKKMVTINKTVTFTPPYQTVTEDGTSLESADYRNIEPFCEYYLTLPGVGIIPIEIVPFLEQSPQQVTIEIEIAISPYTGDISYTLGNGKAILKYVTGNFGVHVPIAQQTSNPLSTFVGSLEIGGGVSAVAAGAATGNVALAAGGLAAAIDGIGQIMQGSVLNTNIRGSMGGWSTPEKMLSEITLLIIKHEISDNPNNGLSCVGRPCNEVHTLGSLSGFVRCSGAYVQAPCTEEEHNMIAQYVNASANYIFGGLFIE